MPIVSISSLSGTPSQPLSGVIAPQYPHHKREFGAPPPASIAPAAPSAHSANQLATAVASALTQLGLTTPSTVPVTSKVVTAAGGSDEADANSNTPLVLQPQKGLQQVQQYQNVASTFSNLAQALNYTSNGTLLTSSGSGNLTAVFEDLWSSLGASSGSSDTIPSLPSFLQTLAQNFSESGISGLRGVFVDTVA